MHSSRIRGHRNGGQISEICWIKSNGTGARSWECHCSGATSYNCRDSIVSVHWIPNPQFFAGFYRRFPDLNLPGNRKTTSRFFNFNKGRLVMKRNVKNWMTKAAMG